MTNFPPLNSQTCLGTNQIKWLCYFTLDNHGMQEGRETPPPHYAENLVTRERVDPIYSSIRVQDSTLHSRDKFSVIENGFQENLVRFR